MLKAKSNLVDVYDDGQDIRPVKKCRYCNGEIVWLKSKKDKWYPVNFHGLCQVGKLDFHKCKNT